MHDLFTLEEAERALQRNIHACRWISSWLACLNEGREVWMVQTEARLQREIYNRTERSFA